MEISGKINSADFRRMADEALKYKPTLQEKLNQFVRLLTDKGIVVAKDTAGNYGNKIVFSRRSDSEGTVLVAQETEVIISKWLRKGFEVEAEVSPLLMAEFGAGPHAIVWEGVNESTNKLPDGKTIGRGTFPNQTHAFEDSWWYMDANKQWHQSRGITPTRPLHNAVVEMILQIETTAKEVFRNGSN